MAYGSVNVLGGGGGGVKSVQRGKKSISSSDTTVDLAINSVDIKNSVIITTPIGQTDNLSTQYFKGDFINSNTVRFTRSNSGSSSTVSWTIVEFENIKKTQVIKLNTVNNSNTVNIENINPAKILVFSNHCLKSKSYTPSNTYAYTYQYSLDFNSSINATSMTITFANLNGGFDGNFYLVEFN